MSTPNDILWFPSSQSWVIPAMDRTGTSRDGRTVRASQVTRPGGAWTFAMPYPEDALDLERAQVGDWVVEDEDGHRRLLDHATFVKGMSVDSEGLLSLADDKLSQAGKFIALANMMNDEYEARGRLVSAANRLTSFSSACRGLAERGRWPGEEGDRRGRGQPVVHSNFAERGTWSMDVDQENEHGFALEKIRQAFSGESPLTVWITRTVRQEIPSGVVQSVMRAISEHGGDGGGRVSFDSLGRHRDTALDALLRSGSEYTMGIPIEDSLSQKQWNARGIRASSRMVDLTREMLAPLEMSAIRNANPGDVVSLPFNQDGYFGQDAVSAQKRAGDDASPSAANHDGEGG